MSLQRTFSVEEIKTIDKHPAFKLIIDFVTNEAYSHKRLVIMFYSVFFHFVSFAFFSLIILYLYPRICDLLQQRNRHANTVADIYLFAADFLRISSETDTVQVKT